MDVITLSAAKQYVDGKLDKLAGKKVLCLGDSLMAGDGWAGGFANCLQENHPTAEVINIAVSGATLIQNDTGKFVYNQFKAYKDAGGEAPDLVIFDGGGNDCLYRANMGTGKLDSCYINGHNGTMCDALESLIYAIQTAWPNTKLLYVTTPLAMQWADTTKVPSVPTPDVQMEYLVAREKVLEKWGIPKADIRRDSCLTSCISGKASVYYGDSLHLNEAGYRYVSPVIEDALNKLF